MHLNRKYLAAAMMLALCSHAVVAETNARLSQQQVATKGKTIKVTGTVLDAAGEAVIGANVVVEGTTIGVITDLDGKYELEAPEGANLVISYIGFSPKTIKATRQPATVKLAEDTQLLNEVVVVGYGTMKKTDLTGAVASLRASDMEKEQRQTLQDMLRAGTAGLSVGIETDAKGNTDMMIRGKSTISASTDPLIVLDGVIYPGEMTDINPNDVERIDVLKDASSAAVYGAQAANGVILVTTKKGNSSGKPTISFNATVGAAFTNAIPEVYKGMDYLNFRADVEKAINSKDPSYLYDNPSNLSGDALNQWMNGKTGDPMAVWMNRLEMNQVEIDNFLAGKEVDWKDWIYQNAALRQDYTVSISGKKDDMSYYSSLNYLKNENNIIGGGFSAIRARVNLENKVAGFLTYGVNTQFTARDEGYIGRDNSYTSLSPYGSVYEEDGKTPKYYPNGSNNVTNPLISQTYTDKMKKIYNMNSSLYLKADLPFGFSLQTTYSPRFEWINDYSHTSADHPASKDEQGKSQRTDSTLFYWQWDNMLKWNKTFGKHAFDFTGLLNWEQRKYWSTESGNFKYQPNDVLGFHGIGFGTSPSVSANDTYRTGAAQMARLHYAYDNRYMITATVRRDGYSAFGQENPYAVFPSVALGWVFSEEKFMKHIDWLEYGKLRVSWGKNGNRSIGEYAALMRLDPRDYFYYNSAGEQQLIKTFYSYNMANTGLKWENTESWNFGMDFTFLNGRLGGSLDVYTKKTNDLLNSRQLPSITGYASVTSNIGEVRNKGVELSLHSTNLTMDNFEWGTTFNLSYNKNTIKHLYGVMEDVLDEEGNVIGQKEADDISKGYFIGHALDEVWAYKFIGVWQENEAEEAAKYNQVPGDPKLLDVDKNYKMNNDDKVFLGNTTPKVRWNMRNEFTIFKNWNFSFSMYSYLGHIKSMGRFTNSDALLNITNSIVREYWTPENPTNEFPRLRGNTPSNVSYSIYKKANFLRFDNISVGYSFPKEMIQKLKIQGLSMNLTLKNAGVISGWPAYDPENSDANTPRTLLFGLNMTL